MIGVFSSECSSFGDWEATCHEAARIRYSIDVGGETRYAEPDKTGYIRAFGRGAAFIAGAWLRTDFLDMACKGTGTADGAALIIGSMSRVVDFDNVHHSKRLRKACAAILMDSIGVTTAASGFLVSPFQAGLATENTVRVFDAHTGEGALTRAFAAEFRAHGYRTEWVGHTYSRCPEVLEI